MPSSRRKNVVVASSNIQKTLSLMTFLISSSLLLLTNYFVHCDQILPLTSCNPPFGCFPSSPDFVHPIFRPINLLPDTSAKVNTTFYFYHRKLIGENGFQINKALPEEFQCTVPSFEFRNRKNSNTSCALPLTTELLENSTKLDRGLKKLKNVLNDQEKPISSSWTAVIVHGFLDSIYESSWTRNIKNELFNLQNNSKDNLQYDNVLITDWSGGNGIPYLQATANSRLVGSQIAYLLQKFQVKNSKKYR